jgi:hypothetical protein
VIVSLLRLCFLSLDLVTFLWVFPFFRVALHTRHIAG